MGDSTCHHSSTSKLCQEEGPCASCRGAPRSYRSLFISPCPVNNSWFPALDNRSRTFHRLRIIPLFSINASDCCLMTEVEDATPGIDSPWRAPFPNRWYHIKRCKECRDMEGNASFLWCRGKERNGCNCHDLFVRQSKEQIRHACSISTKDPRMHVC